jgi:hypothetical protein
MKISGLVDFGPEGRNPVGCSFHCSVDLGGAGFLNRFSTFFVIPCTLLASISILQLTKVLLGHSHGLINYKDTKTKCRLYRCLIGFIDWRYS